MTGLFTELFENWIEQRVFEWLHDDRPRQPEMTAGEAEPLEVAVVITGDQDAALRPAGVQCLFKIFQLDVARKIFAGQARAPQEVKHRAREMLKRFARDPASIQDRQLLAERDLQVRESDRATMTVKDRHEKTESARQSEARAPGQKRDHFCRKLQAGPFEPVTNAFPTAPHRRLHMTIAATAR